MSFKLVDTDMLNWLDSKLYKYAGWRKWRGLPEPRSPRLDEITREALRLINLELSVSQSINRAYADWEANQPKGDTITIRKPKRYVSEH